MYRVTAFIWPLLLIGYCIVRFVTAEPAIQEPATQEPKTFDTVIKGTKHLERECSAEQYQTIRYVIVDYPEVKKLASVYLEDGVLTTKEYLLLENLWRTEHKRLVVEGLKRDISPESEGWRTRIYGDSIRTDRD